MRIVFPLKVLGGGVVREMKGSLKRRRRPMREGIVGERFMKYELVICWITIDSRRWWVKNLFYVMMVVMRLSSHRNV
jgi:hypothetical protein